MEPVNLFDFTNTVILLQLFQFMKFPGKRGSLKNLSTLRRRAPKAREKCHTAIW